jgi:hypothetical protein
MPSEREAGGESDRHLGQRPSADLVAVSRHGGAALSVAEQREHGEDSAIVVLAVGEIELAEDSLYIALDRSSAEVEPFRDRAVRAALRDQRKHRSLAVGEIVQSRASPTADEGLDHVRVERRSAGCHALDGVDELGDVAHAILQQIADPGRVVANELEQVGRLEVLREHEDAHGRVRAPDLGRGDQAVVRVPRRHSHVDDRDVRRVLAHVQQQLIGVGGASDHVVPHPHQQ